MLAACWTPQRAAADSAANTNLVYVIPIESMIERGLVYVVRRGVAEAQRDGAAAIIFDMNTPGGRVDAAEEIINIIAAVPVKTCTYVNPNAISAGAIIAFATDEIYMAPGSRIGDAMPLMMSPVGTPQEIPGKIEEKAASYVSSLIRSAAQRKGHDAKLAEAMVRPDIGYAIGDKVICPTNRLLTLTNIEAEQVVERDGKKVPLLSKGTAENRKALLERLGLAGAAVRELRISPAETIARYIEMFSALLLIGGLLGLYIEFKTPGFGLPGILGILLLAIWFWGHHVAGLAGMGEVLLFLLGVGLLLVEIFVIPGFGFIGVVGISMIFLSLLLGMVEHYPGMKYPSMGNVQGAVVSLGISLLVTFAGGVVLARFLPKMPLLHRLVLGSDVSAGQGYQMTGPTATLVGLRGVADTRLRPGGIGVFGERRIDVVTGGEYLEKGAAIRIVESHGSRTVVEEIGKDGAA